MLPRESFPRLEKRNTVLLTGSERNVLRATQPNQRHRRQKTLAAAAGLYFFLSHHNESINRGHIHTQAPAAVIVFGRKIHAGLYKLEQRTLPGRKEVQRAKESLLWSSPPGPRQTVPRETAGERAHQHGERNYRCFLLSVSSLA